jgi:hypothetical protein
MPPLPLTTEPTMTERPLEGRERLDIPRVLGYGGAVVAIFAIYSLMVVVARHGRWATLGVALAYTVPLIGAVWFYRRKGLRRTAGLLATVTATLAAWIVYAVEQIADWSPASSDFLSTDLPASTMRWRLFALLVAPALAALVAFAFLRFSFLFAVAVPSLILALLDLSPIVIGENPSHDTVSWTAVVLGAGAVAVGLFFDAVARRRDGFWWHVFGLSTALLGLLEVASGQPWLRWAGLALAVAVALAAAILRRQSWAALAGVGLLFAVSYHVGAAAERRHWLAPLLFSLVALAVVAVSVRPRAGAVVAEPIPVVPPVEPVAVEEPVAEEPTPAVDELPPPVDETPPS